MGGRAVGVSAIGCLLCGSEIGVWTLLRIHRGRWIAAIESQKILPRSAAWRWRNPGSVTSSQYMYIYIYGDDEYQPCRFIKAKPYNKPMVYDQWYISTNGIKSWDGEIWT